MLLVGRFCELLIKSFFLQFMCRHVHSGTFGHCANASNDIGHLCDFAMMYGIKEPISG